MLDGNGYIARLLMNIVLMHADLLAVIFKNDKEYRLRVIEGLQNRNLFVDHLKHTLHMISQRVLQQLPLIEGKVYISHCNVDKLYKAFSRTGLLS